MHPKAVCAYDLQFLYYWTRYDIELHCNRTDGWRETHISDLSSLWSVFSVHKECGSFYHLDASLRSHSVHSVFGTCCGKLSPWTLVAGLFPGRVQCFAAYCCWSISRNLRKFKQFWLLKKLLLQCCTFACIVEMWLYCILFIPVNSPKLKWEFGKCNPLFQ